DLLSNLYQVAREFEKAVPIIERAAKADPSKAGQVFERLGRSYIELNQWDKAEDAFLRALNAGNLKSSKEAWRMIGQARYEQEDRPGACEAFRNANNAGARGWLNFMRSEAETAHRFEIFTISTEVVELENERKACNRLKVLGENVPDGCNTVEERVTEARSRVEELQGRGSPDGCSNGV
ncbi:MAG: tetratricopeptide repeat protein, partial [Pseudomonadota bacterium]